MFVSRTACKIRHGFRGNKDFSYSEGFTHIPIARFLDVEQEDFCFVDQFPPYAGI